MPNCWFCNGDIHTFVFGVCMINTGDLQRDIFVIKIQIHWITRRYEKKTVKMYIGYQLFECTCTLLKMLFYGSAL